MIVIRLITLWFFAFFLPIQVYAYSISAHTWLTERAVKEYNFCAGVLHSKSLPTDASKLLTKSNAFEDRAIHIKAVNWHFYHPTKDLGSGTLGLGHASLRWRFQTLANRVKIGHSLKSLGALIHYIQDVTNPAHVAPVYHVFSDSFDNFNFTSMAPPFLVESECQNLVSLAMKQHSYDDLLESVTRETLSRMDESFSFTEGGKTQTINWKEAFWNPEYSSRSKQKGFGHYGRFGNKFGVAQNKGVSIAPSVFSEFAKRQIRQALDATIVSLAMFQITHSTPTARGKDMGTRSVSGK